MNAPNVIDRFDGGPYAFLSNFYPCVIEYEGITYPTTEHAYQAAKTLSEIQRTMIAALPTAAKAKHAGKHVDLRKDWTQVKDQVMYDLCWLKFNQPHLKQLLLDTGDAELIEGNWWHDTYWGVCNGVGRNQLGKTLMQIRSLLKFADNQ